MFFIGGDMLFEGGVGMLLISDPAEYGVRSGIQAGYRLGVCIECECGVSIRKEYRVRLIRGIKA